MFIKKIIFILIFTVSIFELAYTQEPRDYRAKDDEGLYWANHFQGKYNYFGALYKTRLFYKKALFREKNSFFFADSHISAGTEFEVANFFRASAFVEFQPLIALNFLFRFTYEKSLANNAKPALVDGAGGRYNQALPPFTGLNPETLKPIYEGGNTLMIDISPTLTIGGPLGTGLLALIYNPIITYIHGFGLESGSYHYYGKDNFVVKDRDFYFVHDIKLGYKVDSISSSFAIITDIEHIASYKGIWRLGVFAGYMYSDKFGKNNNIIPFVNAKIGTWLIDKYAAHKVSFFLDAGLTWKVI